MEESERHVKELNSKYERVIADAADGRKQQDGNNSKIRTLIEEVSLKNRNKRAPTWYNTKLSKP